MKLRPAWGKGPVWQRGSAHRVVRIGWTSLRKLTVRPSKVEDVVVEGVPGVVALVLAGAGANLFAPTAAPLDLLAFAGNAVVVVGTLIGVVLLIRGTRPS